MQKITPFLWFDHQAEEAVRFYTSLFKNSKIKQITRYGEEDAKVAGRPVGSVLTIAFQLEGQDFTALNGGPVFTFSQAISFFVNCKTQAEVDRLWERLAEGGEKQPCGWVKDQYGVTWQIVPSGLNQLLRHKDASKARRAMAAMLKMTKLDIRALKQAAEGKGKP